MYGLREDDRVYVLAEMLSKGVELHIGDGWLQEADAMAVGRQQNLWIGR